MTDLDDLLDGLITAVREDTASYEWGTGGNQGNDVSTARSALTEHVEALAAELRAARAVCELITLWAGVEMTTLHPDIAKALAEWKKARGEG